MEDYNTINSFPRPKLPDGFRTLLYSLSKEVLREQPADIYAFCADFFGKQLITRGDSWMHFRERYQTRSKEKATQRKAPESITEDTVDVTPVTDANSDTVEEEGSIKSASFHGTPPVSTTESKRGSGATLLKSRRSMDEDEKAAIIKIQAGVRGMLARQSLSRVEERKSLPAQQMTAEDLERWYHPQEQMEVDMATKSSLIDFAQLEDRSGDWEQKQRWLHPEEQLRRDFATDSEPVELAHTRDRTGSVEDINWWEKYQRWTHPLEQLHREFEKTTGDSIDYADTRDRTFSAMDIELPPPPDPNVVAPSIPPASPSHSDIDVAGDDGQTVDAGKRAGSPAEATSPAHSEVEMADRAKRSGTGTPTRAGSVPSIKSTPHSEIDIAGANGPSPHGDTKRSPSLESSAEDRGPSGDGTTPPPSSADIRTQEGRHTTSSPVELGGDEPGDEDPTERAGSPPEVGSPAHSDIELGSEVPAVESKRAGSPAEALSPAHSEVDVPETVSETPTAEQPDNTEREPPQTASQAHSDIDVATTGDGLHVAGRAGSPPEAASASRSQEQVAEEDDPTEDQPEAS